MRNLVRILCGIAAVSLAAARADAGVEINSLKALAAYAQQDNVSVRLKPGVYELNNPAMGQELDMKESKYGWEGRHNEKVALLHFSGSNSRYDLTGTKINLDTQLHAAFGKREILEVFITGDSNTISGMTLIENSRGDAMYGPLLTFLGPGAKNCKIDLELMPGTSNFPVPRVLEVNGTGHVITVRKFEGKRRRKEAPIVFGESDWGDIHLFRAPDSDPREYPGAYSCTLTNLTGMPIIFSELSENCTVVTDGEIKRKRGRGHKVEKVKQLSRND